MVAQPSLAQRDHDGAARLLDGGVGVEQRLLVGAEHSEGAGRSQVSENREFETRIVILIVNMTIILSALSSSHESSDNMTPMGIANSVFFNHE